jgi:chromosome segregation ATPase
MDDELDGLRADLTTRQQQLAALNGEVARLRAREPVEQAQRATLGRQLDQVRAEEAAAQRDVTTLETSLGAGRPPRRVSVAQAEELLHAVSAARAEVRGQVERLQAEGRRVQADLDRGAVQKRQSATEREKAAAALQAAFKSATTQHEEALRVLGARRQQSFERHAETVLSGMEESLTQVDRVFIEPARRALLERAGVSSQEPGALRARAGEMSAGLPAVQAASRAALDSVREEIAKLRGWVDGAPARCRGPWG